MTNHKANSTEQIFSVSMSRAIWRRLKFEAVRRDATLRETLAEVLDAALPHVETRAPETAQRRSA